MMLEKSPMRPAPRAGWLAPMALLSAFGACTGATTPVSPPPPPVAAPAAVPLPVQAEAVPKSDRPAPAGLLALQAELLRAMKTLRGADPPVHHLAYTVTHHETVRLAATYGVIETDSERVNRTLDVDLRAGAPAFDSHHPSRQIGRVSGHAQAFPLEDGDPLVLRQVAWNATDHAYKDIAERFVALKNQREIAPTEEDTSPDFSTEAATQYIGEPSPPLGLDLPAWRKRLATISTGFKGEKEIHSSHVNLEAAR